MKINKKGKVIPFICNCCDCEFTIGIHDNKENYADCPMCGAECYTDSAKVRAANNKEEPKERIDDIPVSWLEQYTRLKCAGSWHDMALSIIETWKNVNKD